MRIAVLGASGFAGKAVCEELKRGGYSVGRFSPSVNGFDLLDISAAAYKLEVFDPAYIVNCAAMVGSIDFVGRYGAQVLDVNTRMILNLYQAARDLRCTIINPVANCGYPGWANNQVESEFENGPLHPTVEGYGFTRRLMLAAARANKAQYGIDTISLITPNMYGPGDSTDPDKTHALNALVIKFLLAERDGAPEVEIWGTGAPVREWLYVHDFAQLVRRSIETGPRNMPVNLAQNGGCTITEIAGMVCNIVGYRGNIYYNHARPDGSARKVMDNGLFLRKFPGFDFTPLEAGIVETIGYYREVL
jgi:GDP-L-fucose synthase